MYVELHAASAFSFLQGASLPEALVERAAALGYPALAVLDADGVYGAPRFHKAALKAGIRPIIGAELTITSAVEPAGATESATVRGCEGARGRTSAPSHSRTVAPSLAPSHLRPLAPSWSLPVLVESA